jgi:hypothetical protein
MYYKAENDAVIHAGNADHAVPEVSGSTSVDDSDATAELSTIAALSRAEQRTRWARKHLVFATADCRQTVLWSATTW